MSQFLRGAVRLHILHHASQGKVHGAWMSAELERHGYRISPGTLYPTLHRMQDDGLLVSAAEIVDGRTRRVYSLTDAGRPRSPTSAERCVSWRARFSGSTTARRAGDDDPTPSALARRLGTRDPAGSPCRELPARTDSLPRPRRGAIRRRATAPNAIPSNRRGNDHDRTRVRALHRQRRRCRDRVLLRPPRLPARSCTRRRPSPMLYGATCGCC